MVSRDIAGSLGAEAASGTPGGREWQLGGRHGCRPSGRSACIPRIGAETSHLEERRERRERRLLVGYARDVHGEDSLALADVLCGLMGARPTVLRVVPVAGFLLGDDIDLALEREAHDGLTFAQERLAAHDPRTRATGDSSIPRALFDEAEREGSSVIVVGSTHRGKVGRLLAGSTATALLHGAPAAVAVAPLGYAEAEPRSVKRIGVAVDGSDESLTALAGAIELAEAAGAELAIFTAVEPTTFGYGPAIEALTAGEIESEATEHARRVLADAVDRVPADIPGRSHLIRGDIGQQLEEESKHLDLLMLGSRGYGPLRATLIGSVSRHAVSSAHCPVLITPRGVGSQPFGDPEAAAD
ncbi:MAG: universal stress protein [Solirubrobacterales bacterium]|nr:universal stress protein [Solirubrobacterales bacterium]MCO5327446.1 universal stress protein [Solirubrobacterales bacterium]